MAEPDHGDREVTVTSRTRRRARRPAGPPHDGAAPTDTSAAQRSAAPTGRGRTTPTGKPVKSSPMGRKRKPAAAPRPEATTDAVDLINPPVSEPAEVDDNDIDDNDTDDNDTDKATEQTAVTATRVSYRERRSAGRRTDSKATSGKASTGPRKKRANPRGLGIVLAAITALGLITAMAVSSTFFVLGTNKIDDRSDLRAEYSAFARQMVTNLTTLNPQNIDASIKSFQDDTSGKAMEQVGQSVEQTVNMIKSENVSTKGTVISVAVTASDANTATVIMVFGWEMNQPDVTDQQTVLQTFRWKLEITRINGDLKLTNVEWVT